jgi:sulfide:quinone oxidoreductase
VSFSVKHGGIACQQADAAADAIARYAGAAVVPTAFSGALHGLLLTDRHRLSMHRSLCAGGEPRPDDAPYGKFAGRELSRLLAARDGEPSGWPEV